MSRVLTGDRPTGALHLGHYFGTLANRVRLQQDGHEIFVVIADYQVIIDRDRPGALRETVRELVRDYLAVGLDPDATVIFPHSAVPALNQLLLPFLSLVSMGELTRNPTVKDEIHNAGRRSVSGLTFTYPVHQAADILFCKGELVPVGRDQLPHLELTRSIARRFGERYGAIFPLPEPLLGEAPVLRGLDGRKMGKSLGNAIALRDDTDTIAAKIRSARTDSDRTITFAPESRPDVANLLTMAALASGRDPHELAAEVGDGGAAHLKSLTVDAVDSLLAPMRARRAAVDDDEIDHVLSRGVKTATAIAETTLAEVVHKMGMDVITL
jgi:tryptophanyl-tRNA synthetase